MLERSGFDWGLGPELIPTQNGQEGRFQGPVGT